MEVFMKSYWLNRKEVNSVYPRYDNYIKNFKATEIKRSIIELTPIEELVPFEKYIKSPERYLDAFIKYEYGLYNSHDDKQRKCETKKMIERLFNLKNYDESYVDKKFAI